MANPNKTSARDRFLRFIYPMSFEVFVLPMIISYVFFMYIVFVIRKDVQVFYKMAPLATLAAPFGMLILWGLIYTVLSLSVFFDGESKGRLHACGRMILKVGLFALLVIPAVLIWLFQFYNTLAGRR